MEFNKINTYFPVDFRIKNKGEACFNIFPETIFTDEQLEEIEVAMDSIWDKYFPMCMSHERHDKDIVCIFADYQYCGEELYDEILESFMKALNNISGIKKLIINDGSEFEGAGWDEFLGLTQLDLNYTVHAEGIEGECFDYTVYFTDGTADKEKADAVSNAIRDFDFKLTDNDYAGYLNVSSENDKILIYLDLGNVEPKNENKIIHGILLALDSVQGIKKVIINE
ncbi:MAG: hypothetical protein NC040_08220 [Muribaculaceae bacterium]|nr:hypothetical protein [Alistipes senegalensis]MCM1474031.1 hypothetical protein [Muribaculaceae bacterium]